MLSFSPLFPPPYRLFLPRFPWVYFPGWWHYLNPVTYWRTIKTFFQRGLRGYADSDVWSFDLYLSHVLAPALRRMQKNHSGFPNGMYPLRDGEIITDPTEEETELADAKWTDILGRMAAGFEAAYQIDEWTTYAPPEILNPIIAQSKQRKAKEGLQEWLDSSPDYTALWAWEAEKKKQVDEALQLFAQYFGNLWD